MTQFVRATKQPFMSQKLDDAHVYGLIVQFNSSSAVSEYNKGTVQTVDSNLLRNGLRHWLACQICHTPQPSVNNSFLLRSKSTLCVRKKAGIKPAILA